jgi:hypothetical protein
VAPQGSVSVGIAAAFRIGWFRLAITLFNPQVEGADVRPGSLSLKSDFIVECVYI